MPQKIKKYSVSVVIPARDEAGTVSELTKRIPKMGKQAEVIFVEGFSKDNTWEEISKLKVNSEKLKVRAFKEEKRRGKARAVELGLSKAKGDILMILDADLSVPPESLTKFYKLLAQGQADFANGSRFVYAPQKGSMRYFNHLGNRFFAFVFSIITGNKITDTLCGTKAFFRQDYARILNSTREIRSSDPYGDFTLLLGAGKIGLKIAEVPVKYKARIYGKSKINPFVDGIRLMILLAKDFIGYLGSI